MVEAWNGANSIIFYGKNSEIASNRRDEQKLSVLCLRICQAALVYVNVLMIQDILDDPDNPIGLGAEDERGLTPLFWSHVLPCGEVKLNMNSRLALGGHPRPTGRYRRTPRTTTDPVRVRVVTGKDVEQLHRHIDNSASSPSHR